MFVQVMSPAENAPSLAPRSGIILVFMLSLDKFPVENLNWKWKLSDSENEQLVQQESEYFLSPKEIEEYLAKIEEEKE